MPGILKVEGRLSVPWSLQDAFGSVYPRAFLLRVKIHSERIPRCLRRGSPMTVSYALSVSYLQMDVPQIHADSLTDQTTYCQEVDGHNLEGFPMDINSLD
jgi:hypothetical protein